MAFGATTAIFREWSVMTNKTVGTSYVGLVSDAGVKVALFNNTTTPDKDAALASTGFNAGVWVTGNEVTDTNWPTKGNALAGKAFTTPGAGIAMFDATDLSHTGTVTLTNAYGGFLFDDTISGGSVVDQGVGFYSFGGAQSITAGVFTIVWHANGLFRITS